MVEGLYGLRAVSLDIIFSDTQYCLASSPYYLSNSAALHCIFLDEQDDKGCNWKPHERRI